MNDATLAQGTKVLNLILQKKTSVINLQRLIDSGILSDLFEVDPRGIDRLEFRQRLGLETPFSYGGDLVRLAEDWGKSPLSMILDRLDLDTQSFESEPLTPVTYKNPNALLRPVWYSEMGQAFKITEDVKKYGWEMADAFDAAFYFYVTMTSERHRHTTFVAPATFNDSLSSWFAIDCSRRRAFWWQNQQLRMIHGNGVQYLVRKSLPA
jgi:hypothetical protein